jgi:hypothetical protein
MWQFSEDLGQGKPVWLTLSFGLLVQSQGGVRLIKGTAFLTMRKKPKTVTTALVCPSGTALGMGTGLTS